MRRYVEFVVRHAFAVLLAVAGVTVLLCTQLPHVHLEHRLRALLPDHDPNVDIHYRIGDGTLGWPEEAPFDRILVTAGAPDLPASLFHQLAEGGLLVAPLGDLDNQYLAHIRKQDGLPVRRVGMPCRFVKLVGEEGWAE